MVNHGEVNKKNESDGTFPIADKSFQKCCVRMHSNLIESVSHGLVSLSFVF